jgi:hypothetical protein
VKATLERQAAVAWLTNATHVHYGVCDVCGRARDENGGWLLVARQHRARRFLCLECWDARK